MSDLTRIIVVDTGDRPANSAVSAELAELGIASVTTSLEAASEVIASLPAPDAIVLHLPDGAAPETRADFAAFAGQLERSHPALPVITLDGLEDQLSQGGMSVLQSQIAAAASAKPPRI